MTFSHDFSYVMDEGLALLPGLLSILPSLALHIAVYALTAMALYTIAGRRGINHPWLSWVPVANVWILGSLSDQYRYVVKGENKSKRKVLLILKIASAVITLLMIVALILAIVGMVEGMMFSLDEDEIFEDVIGPLLSIAGLCLPLAGLAIAELVIRYMALYDLYTSCDPQNNVLFLVLSVLFSVTEPFFLFFIRHKDGGMPPRRQEPRFIPPQPDYERPQPQWQPPEHRQENWDEPNYL